MNNGDKPASPLNDGRIHMGIKTEATGLSKRELFAAMAMQGFIASLSEGKARNMVATAADINGVTPKVQAARTAVEYADALLAALEEGK